LGEALRRLGHEALDSLHQAKVVRVYASGERLFYEGEPPLAVFCVSRGRIRQTKATLSGEEMVLGFLAAGEIAGVEAAITGTLHDVTAVAEEQSVVCILPRTTFEGLLSRAPALTLALYQRAAHHVQVLRGRLVELAYSRVPQRVARAILDLLDDVPREPGCASLQLQRQDLAQMVGSTTETVSRILHSFGESGMVDLSGSRIEVRDLTALRALAHGESSSGPAVSGRRAQETTDPASRAASPTSSSGADRSAG